MAQNLAIDSVEFRTPVLFIYQLVKIVKNFTVFILTIEHLTGFQQQVSFKIYLRIFSTGVVLQVSKKENMNAPRVN